MNDQTKDKLNKLEAIYLEAKSQADLVPALQRKVAELELSLARASKRVVTEDTAAEIADTLVGEGFLKTASREDFINRIVSHPDEIADTVRKVASVRAGAVQIGSASSFDDAPAAQDLDPLTAFALS